MKKFIAIIIFLSTSICIISCKTKSLYKSEDYSYSENIIDSTSRNTIPEISGKFVYSENDSIIIKGKKEDFEFEIKALIDSAKGKLYKETYQEMYSIILDEFSKSDSVNLNEIKTTKLIIYPIYGLAKNEKLYVNDKRNKTPEKLIWEKSYYGESLYKDSIRMRFYDGKLFSTKSGRNFFRVELRSGH